MATLTHRIVRRAVNDNRDACIQQLLAVPLEVLNGFCHLLGKRRSSSRGAQTAAGHIFDNGYRLASAADPSRQDDHVLPEAAIRRQPLAAPPTAVDPAAGVGPLPVVMPEGAGRSGIQQPLPPPPPPSTAPLQLVAHLVIPQEFQFRPPPSTQAAVSVSPIRVLGRLSADCADSGLGAYTAWPRSWSCYSRRRHQSYRKANQQRPSAFDGDASRR